MQPVRIPIRVKVPKWANRGAQSASQAAGKFKNKVADLKNPTKVIDEVKQPLLGRSSSTSNTRYHRMENPLASSKSKSLNDLSKVSKNKKPEMRDDGGILDNSMNDIRVLDSEPIKLNNPTFKDRAKTKWMKNKKKIKTAVLGGSVDAAMVGGVNVAVQEAYKPDYYDIDFDFENFTATASSLTMDRDSLVKDDPSGDASGAAAGSVHTGGQDYDDCNAEFEYCDEESPILENKIYNDDDDDFDKREIHLYDQDRVDLERAKQMVREFIRLGKLAASDASISNTNICNTNIILVILFSGAIFIIAV